MKMFSKNHNFYCKYIKLKKYAILSPLFHLLYYFNNIIMVVGLLSNYILYSLAHKEKLIITFLKARRYGLSPF